MTETLKSVRDLLRPAERPPASPVYAFCASVALAVSALALAGMMIMGPEREAPVASPVVSDVPERLEDEVMVSETEPPVTEGFSGGPSGTFEISKAP